MTIAAGFVCNDGVVIAADSQETIPGYSKDLTRSKVRTVTMWTENNTSLLSCIYAGAGSTDYIATAAEEVTEALHLCNDIPTAETALDSCLQKFNRERILPWASYPEYERPMVELLIGVSVGSAFALFHSSGTAFHRCNEYMAIGSGSILANTLMAQYCDPGDDVDKLIRLAAFVVSKVKSHVDGCGGYTQISALRKGADFALIDGVEEFEEEVDKIEKRCTSKFRSQLFSPSALKVCWLMDAKKKKRRRKFKKKSSS